MSNVVKHNYSHQLTMADGTVLRSSLMAARPIFHKEFGQYLTGLRERKGWTQRQATSQAQRAKLLDIGRQLIWRLEQGKVKHPAPAALKALSALYGEPYEHLVQRFVAAHYGVDVADPVMLAPEPLPGEDLEWLTLWQGIPDENRGIVRDVMKLVLEKGAGEVSPSPEKKRPA